MECLRCGTTRLVRRDAFKRFEEPECPRCGYLGWAPALGVTEPGRRAPHEPCAQKKRHLLRSRRSAA